MSKLIRSTYVTRPAIVNGEPELHHGEGHVLVERVQNQHADALVRPTTVHQQEFLKESELGNRIVTGQHGLHTLLTTDTNTYNVVRLSYNRR